LKRAWQAWKRIAHKIGNFQARVLLTIFYVVLVFPFGIAACLFFDPLRIKAPSYRVAAPRRCPQREMGQETIA